MSPFVHVEHDHPPPLPPAAVSVRGSVEQRDHVVVARYHVVQLQSLAATKRLAAAPKQFHDLARSSILAPEPVSPDVVERRVRGIQASGLRVIGAHDLEVATDQLGSGLSRHAPPA